MGKITYRHYGRCQALTKRDNQCKRPAYKMIDMKALCYHHYEQAEQRRTMKRYECWIVLNSSGHLFGQYDYTNGGFGRACRRSAFLNYYASPEIYSLVQISGGQDKK